MLGPVSYTHLRLDARKDEVIAAARQANVDHFIRTLPDGYDMIVNEEANNISQGEKQLLTIARAILKNPPIMILDEATSSVDTRLEKMLQEAMHNVMQGLSLIHILWEIFRKKTFVVGKVCDYKYE